MVASPESHPGWVIISFHITWPKINTLNFFYSFSSPPSLFQLPTLNNKTWRLWFCSFTGTSHGYLMCCCFFIVSIPPVHLLFLTWFQISHLGSHNTLQWLSSSSDFLLFQTHAPASPLQTLVSEVTLIRFSHFLPLSSKALSYLCLLNLNFKALCDRFSLQRCVLHSSLFAYASCSIL